MEEVMTVDEVAQLLRKSRDRIYRLMLHTEPAERLPSFKVGGSRRVRRTELMRWIEQRERDPHPA